MRIQGHHLLLTVQCKLVLLLSLQCNANLTTTGEPRFVLSIGLCELAWPSSSSSPLRLNFVAGEVRATSEWVRLCRRR